MTEQSIADADLSAEEKAYFETAGENDLPGGDNVAQEVEPTDGEAAAQAGNAEQEAASGSDSSKKDDEPRKVDYRALKEERERRQFAEQQLANLNRQFQTVDQRLAALQHAMQPREPQQAIPDPEHDFIGWAKWQHEQTLLKDQQQEQARRAAHAHQQENEYWSNVRGTWINLLRQSVQNDPELEHAYNFTLEQRRRELMASGLDENTALQRVRMDELQFVAQHLQAGQSPVHVLKQVAAARGWQPPQQTAQQQPAEKLAAVQRAQEANKSLTPVGTSGNARGSLTAKDLGEMSDDDFAKFLSDKGGKGFRAIMGG